MENTSIKVVEEKVNSAVAEAAKITIATPADLDRAVATLTGVKKLQKFIEQEKKKITDPQRAALEATRDLFRPFEDGASKAEKQLKDSIAKYQMAQIKVEQKREGAIAKAVESGRMKEETGMRKLDEIERTEKTTHAEGGESATMKMVTQVEVVDRSLVPDEYWEIDMVKLRKVAAAGVEIPGVKVTKVPSVSVRV